MTKSLKALLLVLALCLCGAVPATASAAGILYSGSSEAAVGTQISGHSVLGNIKFYTGSSVYFECTGAKLNASVAANRSESMEAGVESLQLTGPNSEERCGAPSGYVKITLKTPACLRYGGSPKSWIIRGAACLTGATAPHLVMTYSWGGTCEYRTPGTAALSFTSNVNTEPLLLTQTSAGTELIAEPGSSFLCSAAMTMKNLNLQLETASGGGLKVTS